MDKTRLFVEGVKTDSGKIYINSKEIGREIDRIKETEPAPQENNIIKLYDNPQFKTTIQKWDWGDNEYVDDPNEEEFKNIGRLSKIVTCIKDGIKIVSRRKKGGKKR